MYLSCPNPEAFRPESPNTGLARRNVTRMFSPMTASDVISHLRTLPTAEVAKVRQWILEQADESPELLAAVDAGLRSLERTGPRLTTRKQLETKVRRWTAGGSR